MLTSLRSFGLLAQWETNRLRANLPIMVFIQTLVGTGMVVGMAFLVPNLDRASAAYLATAGPTLALFSIGLQIVPQQVAEARRSGAWEFMSSLPVPPLAYPAALLTVQLFASLPGMVLALAASSMRFDLDLAPGPEVVPIVLLVALTTTGLGFLIALLSPNPMLSSLITAALLFAIMLFSPVTFPVERLPAWLETTHQYLPFEHMATAVRLSLMGTEGVMAHVLIVGAWCAGIVGSVLVVSVRRA